MTLTLANQSLIVPTVLLVVLTFVLSMIPAFSKWYCSAFEDGRKASLAEILGARDVQPIVPQWGQRAQRALANHFEAMMLFVPLFALYLGVGGVENGIWGIWVFLGARTLYAPSYILGISTVRTLFWAVGHFGIVLIAVASLATLGTA